MSDRETSRLARDLEALLAEEPFLRALARSVAGADADDAVQEACVVALERAHGPVLAPRRWFARIVQNVARDGWRSERRRAERERRRSAATAVPSPAEWLERDERRRALLDAVNALPTEQREVVLLRYYEGRPPRRIARDLGLPVATVVSRLRAGIAALRRALARERGRDLRAWLLPLLHRVPRAGVAPAAAPTLTTGVLSMTSTLKVGAAALAVAAAALWAVSRPTLEPGVLAVGDGAASPPLEDVEIAAPESALEDPGVDARSEALGHPTEVRRPAALALADTGTLVVSVVHGASGAAAPDVLLSLDVPGAGDGAFDDRLARTDADGVAHVESLRPGEVAVTAEARLGNARATVVAGRETHARLALEPGATLRGEVVDETGFGVPGAHVHLGYVGLARPVRHVATADAAGRFELRAVMPRCLLGARAEGYAASPLQLVGAEEGEERDLRLVLAEPGGVVAGRVLDPAGEPLGGAVVSVGDPRRTFRAVELEGGAFAVPPDAACVRSQPDGHYRAVGLPLGEHRVEARAGTLGAWRGTCVVEANGVTPLEVRLERCAALRGMVRDEEGAPLAGVDVRCGDPGSVLYRSVRSGAEGAFRLDGLVPGACRLVVDGGSRGDATEELELSAGEERALDVELSAGLVLRGRVVGGDVGAGPVVVVAEAMTVPGLAAWAGRVLADEEGRFAISDCPRGRPLVVTLDTADGAAPRLADVDPRAGEVELRLPE